MCLTEGEESWNAAAAEWYKEAVYKIVRIKFTNLKSIKRAPAEILAIKEFLYWPESVDQKSKL